VVRALNPLIGRISAYIKYVGAIASAKTHSEKFIAASGTKSGRFVRSMRADIKAPVNVPTAIAVPKIPYEAAPL
jgi:hypothetical protein